MSKVPQNVNISFLIDAKHAIKRWRAPNGFTLDISEAQIFIIVAGGGICTLFKRWKEIEHGVITAATVNDNDYLISLNCATINNSLERIFPNPISTKFLTFGLDTTLTTHSIKCLINGQLRKITPTELAEEIAQKND